MSIEAELFTCRKCRRLTNRLVGGLCGACYSKQDELFTEVREYIYAHKKANMQEITREFNIEPLIIEKWIRDGRLEVTEDSPIKPVCERCGTSILTGKYCVECQGKVIKSLNQALEPSVKSVDTVINKKDNTNRMRFL